MLTTHLYAASNPSAESAAAPAPGRTLVQEAVVLTVLNRGSGSTPAQLVLFKRNSAADADGEQPVLAWKVVRCAPGQRVHVVVPFSQQVGVFDPCGPHAGMEPASAGDLFAVAPSPAGAGPALRKVDGADGTVGANMVGVRSRAVDRPLDVVLYKDGRPLCRHSRLQAGALAMFEVLPYLHVADGSGLVEGELIDAALVRAATRISLLGLKSADLVWTATSAAPVFQLANQRFS
jgi:hypothetical protein